MRIFTKIVNAILSCFVFYSLSNFIITSNRKTESWYQLFPDPVMANAALDRIIYNSYCVVLEGESYRKNFMPMIQKTEELKK